MPIFTVPIHEHGTPGEPNYPHPMGGSKPLTAAQLVRPGQSFDLRAAAQAGHRDATRKTRRFLFNPASREFALGVASGTEGRDQSHAEALDAADGDRKSPDPLAQGRRYDRFVVHGHIQNNAATVPTGLKADRDLAIVIDRVIASEQTPGGYNQEARAAEASDLLAALARRLASMGATSNTPILSRDLGSNWTTLGKAFPDVFPKAQRKRAA